MALSDFHPACRQWFRNRFGEPTAAQGKAWPAIRAGKHTLISAPTGSGKTLAAFYSAIDKLVQLGLNNQLEEGVQILYVSPLKALSNDIQRNLEAPLDGIAEQLHLCGEPPVNITVAVRTGDTPASERQKMAKKPPHILVTTPESLYLLLTSASGRAMLSTVSTLIVDEIHAMLGDKRGSHLSLSVERLQNLILGHSGQQLQRIGLSATQKPIGMVAKYLVGNSNCTSDNSGNSSNSKHGDGEAIGCEIVDSGFRRELDLAIEVPGSPLSALMSNEVWEELYQRLIELINSHETTLVFVNTRRLSERLALALSERLGEKLVCSHHGSMSKDHRHNAEQRLKAGELKVLVATASMELGIDIGSVDLVVQFSSPKSIATFLQRVGRSGHSIHGRPKGILFPLTRDDLVEASALLHSVSEGQLDRIIMPEKPLDILSQQIVAELSCHTKFEQGEGWDVDELFKLFRNAYPYRGLEKEEFDTLINMLSEGYTSRRGRRGSHLHHDAINSRLSTRRGANLLALTNGGAIPDMFDYQVVLDPEDIVVGSLNEDFALEALPGDVFTLGTHSWQMLRVDGLKVRVRDAEGMQPTIPFWFGEGPGRTQELSESVSELRKIIADLLINDSANAATQWAVDNCKLPRSGATQMVEYLQSGLNALGVMPSRETIVMERFFDEVGDMHVVIHSPFGSRLNRAWGLALRKRFCRSFNFELQAAANEDSIVISLGSVHSFPLEEVFRYLQTATVREVLIQAMLDAPMFEVRWRWNATRSLAIQRNRNGKRVPPQFQRMDAEDLVAHVFPDQIACQENITGKREIPDHPLVRQTIHDCLTEAMDIDELERLISDIEQDNLTLIAKDLREPSPFAQEIINARPYAFLDDAPFEERRTNAIKNRSWADPGEAKDFSLLDEEAIQRVREEAWPYVNNADELHDALMSLSYITAGEFESHKYAPWLERLQSSGRIKNVNCAGRNLWVATERLPWFVALYEEFRLPEDYPEFLISEECQAEDAVREILRGRLEGCGPITATAIADDLGVKVSQIDQGLICLEVEGYAFQGSFSPSLKSTDGVIEWCERRLLQRIHRYTIDAHRKAIKPVSLQSYTRFLFDRHQLLSASEMGDGLVSIEPSLDGQTQLQNSLGLLDGISAPAASWEADIYPLRIKNYDPNWLDVMCISGRTVWGRYALPSTASSRDLKRTKVKLLNSKTNTGGGPIKSTPIALISRANQDIWQALSSVQQSEEQQIELTAVAGKIEEDLQLNGASFLDQIQSRTGLLKSQLESGLAELVSRGKITSDSYTGLRALLSPNKKKPSSHRSRHRRAMFGVEDAGRWSLLNIAYKQEKGEKESQRVERHRQARWNILDEEQLERLIYIYMQRWGVLFRSLLDKELNAPPWRILLATLRKMELKGAIRGGRFIAGVGGEQFAFPETVEALRKFQKQTVNTSKPVYHSMSACDPLNLINLILPSQKLTRLSQNRVLYENGVPVAVLDSGKPRFLKEFEEEQHWPLQQVLTKKSFPVRLKSYLGSR